MYVSDFQSLRPEPQGRAKTFLYKMYVSDSQSLTTGAAGADKDLCLSVDEGPDSRFPLSTVP